MRLRGACEDIKIPCVDDLTRELNMLLADGRAGKNETEPIPEKWCEEDWPLDPETGKRTYGSWMYESEEFEELPGLHEAHRVVRAPPPPPPRPLPPTSCRRRLCRMLRR